jgi:hypothetical protein
MNQISQKAAVLVAVIAFQGLSAPASAVAGDIVMAGQNLLPKSASTADCQRRGGGGGRMAAAPRPAMSGGGGRNVRSNASSNVNHRRRTGTPTSTPIGM